MDYYMYICPECKKIYKIKGAAKHARCPKCDNSYLIDMGIVEDEWKSTSTTDRHSLIDKKTQRPEIINNIISENNTADFADGNSSYYDSALPNDSHENDAKPKSMSFFDGFESDNTSPTITKNFVPPVSNPVYSKIDSSLNNKIRHSSLSIGAFILSFFGCLSIIGIVLGIVDLKKGDSQSKHGLSIAAIIIGSLLTLCTCIGVSAGFASGLSSATEESTQVADDSLTTIGTSEETSSKEIPQDNMQAELPETDQEPNDADNYTSEVVTREPIPSQEKSTDKDITSNSGETEIPEAKPTPKPTPEPTPEPLSIIDTVIATRLLNVREQPNTNCQIVGEVAEGTKIERYESLSNGWSKVLYNGDTAYISSKYLVTEDEYASIKAQQTATAAVNDTPVERSTNSSRSESNSSGGGGDGSNFDTYDIPEQQNTADQWVLNIKSKKIHYPSCRDVKKISPDNYSTSNLSLQDLQNQGYSPCGHCF